MKMEQSLACETGADILHPIPSVSLQGEFDHKR